MKRPFAWLLMGLLFVVAATLPLWFELPPPREAQAIDYALCLQGCASPGPYTLPLARPTRGDTAIYQLSFRLDALPAEPLYLFIPLLNQRARIALDAHPISETGVRVPMIGLTTGTTALMPLPHSLLRVGLNQVELTLSTQGVARGYLSRIYVGTAAQVAPSYRLRLFLLEHVRLMTLAAQFMILIAVLVAWLYRRGEALFGWTLLLLTLSLFSYAGIVSDLNPQANQLLPYTAILTVSTGFIMCVLALLVSGQNVPRWLKLTVFLVPAGLIGLAYTQQAHSPMTLLSLGPIMVLTSIVASGITAWGALIRGRREAWLLLVPMLAMLAAMLHDTAVTIGWLDGPVFLGIYYRQALTIGAGVILARRLGLSLQRLDEANIHLTQRLAQREQELADLYDAERQDATQRIRHQERQRLTADLHDGLSGHLASIIALAERSHSASIERSAREALDDLRAVIHSLDIGDRELVVALSGFRERLERQLKRTGIALRWSMAQLPEIAGVTPTHALNVLRILQEAITNAVKHGPASRIAILGSPGGPGQAVISIENDGLPFAWHSGSGLENMRRRAQQLNGSIHIEPLSGGTRVTLTLPVILPETAADAAQATGLPAPPHRP